MSVELNIDDTFTLRDYEGAKDAEVEVSERQYRACILDFINNDDAILVDLWAGKIGICVRDGIEGPRDRRWKLQELVRGFLQMASTSKKHQQEDFKGLLPHFLQARLALKQSLEIIDRFIEKKVLAMDDGTAEPKE